MSQFKRRLISYLLSNGWLQDEDGWEWVYRKGLVHRAQTNCLYDALKYQLENIEEA